MPHAVARVRFADFDRFFETFSNRGKAKRAEHGCRGVKVFRVAGDPNAAINVFDWDPEGVEAFMADPETREIMSEAGLEGPPEITGVELAAELEA